MTRVFEGECHGTSAITVPESNQKLLLQDQKLAWRTALNSTDAVGTLAEKKASDLILWDSSTRATKGKLGAPDGTQAVGVVARRVGRGILGTGGAP